MRYGFAVFNFFDEIGVCFLLLALLLLTVLIGRKIKNRKRQIIVCVVFFAAALVSEFIYRNVQRHFVEFIMIAVQFISVPAFIGFGMSALMPPQTKELDVGRTVE